MTVYTPLIGRLGNKLFQYAHARAYCEAGGHQLVTPDWEGRSLFNLSDAIGGSGNITLGGYRQDQASLIYTRAQVKQWMAFREPLTESTEILCHRRVGDYFGAGYVVVSAISYIKAAVRFGFDPGNIEFVTEEAAQDYLNDFRRLAAAPILFRGNSSFSWWAATLGNGRVFSPVIEGLCGGREQDCEFVEGNWPRLANLELVTDLYLG